MKSPELRQRKVQALAMEPLRPVVTFYRTQNTITSLIAAPLDIRTHMVFALFSGVMYFGSALRGVRWELVPKAALPCALDGRLTSLISAAGKTFRKLVARHLLLFVRTYGVCTMQWGHASWFRGLRRRLVPKAARPRALFSPLHISHTAQWTAGSELWVGTGSDLARIHTHTYSHTYVCVCKANCVAVMPYDMVTFRHFRAYRYDNMSLLIDVHL